MREDLYVDGVSGLPIRLYPGGEERLDYRLIDASGNPEDASSVTIEVRASIEPDTPEGQPSGSYVNVPMTIIVAPDQTVGSATRGVFQLVVGSGAVPVGSVPGTVRGDFIVDGKVRAPWKCRGEASLASAP